MAVLWSSKAFLQGQNLLKQISLTELSLYPSQDFSSQDLTWDILSYKYLARLVRFTGYDYFFFCLNFHFLIIILIVLIYIVILD